MPPTASFDKGSIEEWTDLRFFRPLGLRIARAAMPTRISPDGLTAVALVIGLAAGHLCVYNSVSLNALGVALFVVSDVFDSADGQLARMRGTATKMGKILDGLADGARFINLYIHLMIRLLLAGDAAWWVIPLTLAAGLAHAYQSAGIDFIRQLYQFIGEGGHGEFALPEDFAPIRPATPFDAFKRNTYRAYLERHGRLIPISLGLARRVRRDGAIPADLAERWARQQRPIVRQSAWIGQNVRFALLAVTVVPGYPAAYLWITLVPMSLVLAVLTMAHERRAASMTPDTGAPLAEAA